MFFININKTFLFTGMLTLINYVNEGPSQTWVTNLEKLHDIVLIGLI